MEIAKKSVQRGCIGMVVPLWVIGIPEFLSNESKVEQTVGYTRLLV
jgi:hypothetical protein